MFARRPTLKYGTTFSIYDALKLIALLAMIIDHIGYYFYPEEPLFRAVGRLAAPIFLFLVGYSASTKQPLSIWLAAIVLALHTTISGYGLFALNILFTILVVRCVLGLIRHSKPMQHELLIIWTALLFFYPMTAIVLEYGTIAFMFAIMGVHARDGRNDQTAHIFAGLTLAFWLFAQGTALELNPQEMLLFCSLAVIQFFALTNFQKLRLAWHNAPLPALFLARHTLLLYVAHIILFQILANMWHTSGGGFGEFLWMRP